MKAKNFLTKLKVALRKILSGRQAVFAVCSCGLRGPMYVGDVPSVVELSGFGCRKCTKYAHGCWGPRLQTFD